MKQRITIFFLSLALLLFPVFAANAETIPAERQMPRLVDNADLLDSEEENRLEKKLDEISERQQCDVAVVTVNGLGGKSPTAYADDFYDYNGYGYGVNNDGILLLVSMADRDWAITTCGNAIAVFTDAGQEYIVSQFKPDLSAGEYYNAFDCFAEQCDRFLTQAAQGEPFDEDNLPKTFNPIWILVSCALGIVIAFLVVTGMKSQLKSVRAQNGARGYIRPGGFHLTGGNELFLYRNVTRTRRVESSSSSGGSSTHSSSSGRTHGGSSGKF